MSAKSFFNIGRYMVYSIPAELNPLSCCFFFYFATFKHYITECLTLNFRFLTIFFTEIHLNEYFFMLSQNFRAVERCTNLNK